MDEKDCYEYSRVEPLQAGFAFGIIMGGIPMALLAFHFWTKMCH